jgi:hypothetical protein
MQGYRTERIENAALFFARKHYQKTKKYLSQTALYKYLAFFEFRYLKKVGDMPLELTYRAMPRGPVPTEIYENRDKPDYFHKVIFEPFQTKNGTGYLVKPNGKFNPDYFAEAELEEMNNLIDIFAQKWIGASEMSDMSHGEINAWKKTWAHNPNAVIDPINEFDRDISDIPENELTPQEERYLTQKSIREYCLC